MLARVIFRNGVAWDQRVKEGRSLKFQTHQSTGVVAIESAHDVEGVSGTVLPRDFVDSKTIELSSLHVVNPITFARHVSRQLDPSSVKEAEKSMAVRLILTYEAARANRTRNVLPFFPFEKEKKKTARLVSSQVFPFVNSGRYKFYVATLAYEESGRNITLPLLVRSSVEVCLFFSTKSIVHPKGVGPHG